MLSRLNSRAGSRCLFKCIGQFQMPAVCTSAVGKRNQSSQRDLINFPRPTRLENTPETRFGFVPKSWFDFMYPKTGVTGPYTLLTGLGVYLLSKEHIVIDPEFSFFLTGISVAIVLQRAYGTKVREYLEKKQEETVTEMDSTQKERKNDIKKEIALNNKAKWEAEGIVQLLPEAKRENIYLQMEAAYRSRMQEAFAKVKKHLDYQVEKQNVERRIAQRNMVDYIIRNVQASISPQLKSNALKQSINDLKTLSARA